MGSAVFHPDVIVQGTDRPQLRLAVEIKPDELRLDEATRMLRQYMHDEACPLGLLVTPEKTRIYRETYSDTPDSIRELAVVETPLLLHSPSVIAHGPELERAVRGWLETLMHSPGVAGSREDPATWIEEQLLPALVDAEVMVAGPR